MPNRSERRRAAAIKRPLLRKIMVVEQKLANLGTPVESPVLRHEKHILAGLMDEETHDPEKLARDLARDTEREVNVRRAKQLEFGDGLTWMLEVVVMGVLDDLKGDPSFMEEVREMLRNDLKGITRGPEFRKFLNVLMKEQVDEIAAGMFEEHASEVRARAKEIIEAELGPAVDRALRQAIEEHVAEVKKRSGL